jgi:hypothetical protein
MKIQYQTILIGDFKRYKYKSKELEFCCEGLKDAYESDKINFGGDRYKDGFETNKICIRTCEYGDSYWDNIDYCPWCGEKINPIEQDKFKLIREKHYEMQKVCTTINERLEKL